MEERGEGGKKEEESGVMGVKGRVEEVRRRRKCLP